MGLNNCYVKIKSEWKEAEFLGVFQYSNVIPPSPMVGGHPGGVIAYPIAIVKLNEELKEIKISNLKFKMCNDAQSK
jgi:hypothetical protein